MGVKARYRSLKSAIFSNRTNFILLSSGFYLTFVVEYSWLLIVPPDTFPIKIKVDIPSEALKRPNLSFDFRWLLHHIGDARKV
jgi:hypothetical protein